MPTGFLFSTPSQPSPTLRERAFSIGVPKQNPLPLLGRVRAGSRLTGDDGYYSLNCAGFVPTYKGMIGETERTGAEMPPPAYRPETRAQMIAKGVTLAIFMSLAIAGIFAALGMMAADSAAVVLSILFWLWVVSAILNTVGTLYRASIPRDRRTPACNNGGIAVLVIRPLWVALLVALLVGGHYGLAALLGYGFALGIAKRAETRRILGEGHKVWPVSRAVHWIVFGVAEQLAPVYDPVHRLLTRPVGELPLIAWIVLFPIFAVLAIPMLLFELLSALLVTLPISLIGLLRGRKQQQNLVKAAYAGGKLAWFAYSEPHQRERFLGEGGVLHGMDGSLIVREWRRDLYTAWNGDTEKDIDAMIVKRFRLTNMKEDLPVIVLFHPDGRTRPVMLNRAYRQRFRDGGDLLAALEDAIRQQILELRQPAV